jgi:hypothetical protein
MTNAEDDQQPANDSGVGGDAGASGGADTGAGSPAPALIPSSPALESLASCYVPEQHATYLRHLEHQRLMGWDVKIHCTTRLWRPRRNT